jgi:tetratricopeptide (TPR) repeat protein
MKLNEKIILFLLVLLLFPAGIIFSQAKAKPSRQSSMEAFSKGNYEQAYTEFRQLLQTYPKDPLYKYYSAVSLINLKRDAAEAEELLIQALENTASVKSLPADAMFYLGRARQMQGKYEEAIKSYNSFTDQAGKKKAKEMDVPNFLVQCRAGQGKIEEIQKPVAVAAVKSENSEKTSAVKKDSVGTITTELDRKMAAVLDNQYKADSASAALKKQAAAIRKEEIKPVISAETSDTIKREAPLKTSPVQEKTAPAVKKDTVQPTRKPATADQIQKAPSTSKQSIEVFSVFEILPKAVTDPNEKIEINPEVPEGLVYRIQIAVFKNHVTPAFFKGITPIYGFKGNGSAVTTYYAGIFRRSADASKALNTVKSKGFKDSFTVGFAGNKTVSKERAADLEKVWGNKPLYSIETAQEEQVDTIPPTLIFRVEVARTQKPLNLDVIESYRKLAGKRGLDIVKTEDGNLAYLIGNFITFESAAEFANLLTRNGYRDAKVVAWLGRKEIDLETAKQLFENLK